MTNYDDYDDSTQLAAEMQADRWAEYESEMGPADVWPSSDQHQQAAESEPEFEHNCSDEDGGACDWDCPRAGDFDS